MKAALIGIVVLVLAGCGSSSPSISQRVSDDQGVDAVCTKAGVMQIAAERTRIYRCVWSPLPGRTTSPCYAIVDGDLIDMTLRVDESLFPECSHAAAVAP